MGGQSHVVSAGVAAAASLLIVDWVSGLDCYMDACSSIARVPNDAVVGVL